MACVLGRLPRGYGACAGIRNLAISAILALGLPGGAFAEAVTVAALGDSLTQGYGLAAGEGFVPALGRWLEEKGAEFELINAGVSGDTTAGGLSRIDWTLSGDVDALIVALGGNDVLRGIAPQVARANLEGILARAGEAEVPVLLVGIAVPANYGPEYQTAFRAIYPELAEAHGALLYPDFLSAVSGEGDLAGALAEFMQADGIHPNATGVQAIVEDMGPSVLSLIERAR